MSFKNVNDSWYEKNYHITSLYFSVTKLSDSINKKQNSISINFNRQENFLVKTRIWHHIYNFKNED